MKITNIQKANGFVLLLLFMFISSYLISDYGFTKGTHFALLTWSLYILCIPSVSKTAFIADIFNKILLIPYKVTEILILLSAIGINIATYFSDYQIYFKRSSTFLLYRIIVNPWPNWIIIFFSILGITYRIILTSREEYAAAFSERSIQNFLNILGTFLFFYFFYKEIVIILSAATSF